MQNLKRSSLISLLLILSLATSGCASSKLNCEPAAIRSAPITSETELLKLRSDLKMLQSELSDILRQNEPDDR